MALGAQSNKNAIRFLLLSFVVLSTRGQADQGGVKSKRSPAAFSNGVAEALYALKAEQTEFFDRMTDHFEQLRAEIMSKTSKPRDPIEEIRDLVSSTPEISVRGLRARAYTACQVWWNPKCNVQNVLVLLIHYSSNQKYTIAILIG